MRYNELEQLLSLAVGRISGKMLELALVGDPQKGIFGLALNRNKSTI